MYLFLLFKRAFNGVITEIPLTYGTDVLIKLEMLRMRFLARRIDPFPETFPARARKSVIR